MNGRSTSGTTGLGTVEVSGRRRVPSPPTKMTACISGSSCGAAGVWSSENQACHGCREGTVGSQEGPLTSAYTLIDEPGFAHGGRVESVAPIDHELSAHRSGDLPPIELQELGPLG